LSRDSELWLDGGHNDSAGEALAKQAFAWKSPHGPVLHVICGMLTTKKPVEFLKPMAPHIASFTAVPVPNEAASFTPEDLVEQAKAAGIQKTATAPDVETAIRTLIGSSRQALRILICGSLYLAGEVLKRNAAP